MQLYLLLTFAIATGCTLCSGVHYESRLQLVAIISIQIHLPAGKRAPRWGHSMTAVISQLDLEKVIMFGGSSERFGTEYKSAEFPRLAHGVVYIFG